MIAVDYRDERRRRSPQLIGEEGLDGRAQALVPGRRLMSSATPSCTASSAWSGRMMTASVQGLDVTRIFWFGLA
jgi:hypothetical protein